MATPLAPYPATPANSEASTPDMAKVKSSKEAGAQKRCWNCRSRKVACDRAEPSCLNCSRRGLQCSGYGLKLSWPRPSDARRAAHSHQHRILTIRTRKLEFVNATTRDISQRKSIPRWNGPVRILDSPLQIHAPYPMIDPGMIHASPLISTTYYETVSQIISSTCDEMTELYGLLIRMSLGDDSLSALATRHAIAAISYQHLGRIDNAVTHKLRSAAALQAVINQLGSGNSDPSEAFQAMAASMLLNIFQTICLGGTALNQASFLCASKCIAKTIHTAHATYEGDSALVLDWIFYHDTMNLFGLRHWYPTSEGDFVQSKFDRIMSKESFSPLRQLILTTFGCSLELLDLLYQVIHYVFDRDDPRHLGTEHRHATRTLEFRLKSLTQIPRLEPVASPVAGSPGVREEDSAVNGQRAAAMYRLAVYIYLERVARAKPGDDPTVVTLVDDAMQVLRLLPWCERPWPLFVIALEARTEEERRLVIDKLDSGMDKKPLGNLAAIKRLILSAWVRQDLDANGAQGVDQLDVYNAVVRGNDVPPVFT